MDGLSSQFTFEGWTLRFNSTQIAHVSTFIAIGAVARIGLDELALVTPPLFGILIAVGLTETLTFIDGFVYGPTAGFVTGFLIILISDMFTQPGPWTPFIAAIIGLIGLVAGTMRRSDRIPTFRMLAVSAVLLTLMSELLQNAWVALFYSLPIAGVMTLGIVDFDSGAHKQLHSCLQHWARKSSNCYKGQQ